MMPSDSRSPGTAQNPEANRAQQKVGQASCLSRGTLGSSGEETGETPVLLSALAASPSIPEVRFDQVTLTQGAHGARGHSRAGAPACRPVIADLTFEAHGGHIVGVAGPSGIGKTMLLRLVAGLLTPTDGVVTRRFTFVGAGQVVESGAGSGR